MHEYPITNEIIKIIKKNIKSLDKCRVTKINIELGAMTQIEPESVRFYYEALTRDEDKLSCAQLIFLKKSFEIRCSDCSKQSSSDSLLFKCPKCGSRNFEYIPSEEIKVLSLEVDE